MGKEPVRKEESITEIDEYLGRSQIVKKSALKYCQPDNEFWEDYVHFTKTTGTAIKKQFKLRPESKLTQRNSINENFVINNSEYPRKPRRYLG